MKIGAHVSTAGGIDKAIDRAQEIRAETIQIFGSSPQGWAYKPHPPERVQAFRQKAEAAGIGPVFLHGVYLVNLATNNPTNLEKGIDSLIFYLKLAEEIGAQGAIFHVGSHKGTGFELLLPQVVSAMRQVLEATPPQSKLIIENNAGSGQNIGATFQEIGRMITEVGSPRVKVCLDTAHCFASGYDITTRAGLEATMEEFDQEVGLERLVAVHANDSKVPFNSGVDRHENIGHGHIGLEGFQTVMSHPAFRDVPFLLEVPGFDNKGPDRENVELLLSLREKVGLS